MNSQQQQALALAAVFEAATLADQIATSGDCDHAAMEALLDGVMTMEATDFDTIYPRPALFRNGLRLLRQSLNREQTRQAARPLSYSLALLHLSSKLRKNSDVTVSYTHLTLPTTPYV